MNSSTYSMRAVSWLDRLAGREKLVLFFTVFGLFWLLYPYAIGRGFTFYRLFGLLYVIPAAAFWGARVSAVVVVLGITVGAAIHRWLHLPYEGGVAGPAFGLLMALSLGYMRDLNVRLARQVKQLREYAGEKSRIIGELESALKEVKVLRGLLPICSHCKSIRDENGEWLRLEQYISERSDAAFTHGLCPQCLKEHYPELERE